MAILALLAGLLLGGSPARAAGTFSLAKVGGTYSSPTFVAQAPGGPKLLFVVEQAGRIAVLRNGHELDHPFLNIHERVSCCGEQGLLSMAFDPDYRRNRRFYVYYTNHDCSGGCNVEVDSFRRSRGSSTRASDASRRKVIEINHHQAPNHNGGQLQFGPHGDLYLAPGDGGTDADPENDAQNTANLLGKILRIEPRPHGGYDVPPDNPFVGAPGRNQIYAVGLRNPFRFSFDHHTGDLWIGDVGRSAWEEIDRVTPAQANGANFGWHYFEGPNPCGPCGFHAGTDPPPHYVAPVHWYPHSGSGETGSVIIGGYVVRDPQLPSLLGSYVYTDDAGGDLRAYDPATDTESELGLNVSSPSSFGEGLDGSIYVASLGDGHVYELVES